jgi:hypothetical protein
VVEHLQVLHHAGFFVLSHATGARGLDFLGNNEELALKIMKPSWIAFGSGVGLGLFLAVTPPSGMMGKGNVETHREVPRVRKAQRLEREPKPTNASSGRVLEAANRS